jgi:hypothetical protein
MNSDELHELIENPDYIPNIYNYCDGWCERCAFSDRCLQYAMSSKRRVRMDEAGDLDDEALMQQVEEALTSAVELIRSGAAAQGIDLDALDTTDIVEARERLYALVDEHPLSLSAVDYAKLALGWMEAAGPDLQAKGEQWESFVRMNIPGVDVVGQVIDLKDAVEVVQWYLTCIPVEVASALRIRLESPTDNPHTFSIHADGKAKIALIGMDRSLAAWRLLLHALPQRETETLEILAHLARLRHDSERFFPDAQAFVRPGFDTW